MNSNRVSRRCVLAGCVASMTALAGCTNDHTADGDISNTAITKVRNDGPNYLEVWVDDHVDKVRTISPGGKLVDEFEFGLGESYGNLSFPTWSKEFTLVVVSDGVIIDQVTFTVTKEGLFS